jgi:hypothetical protein
MNIIQVQNRLKGVTDEALVQYINNPTGDVPTYLALGEVGRREDMRKEYQASQAEQPQKTVAEEMVAKLSTPTGIGALTNNMAPRMAPEEVMSSSESISETGIAPLPTQNMTQEFARGGIVGSARGGGILDTIKEYGRKIFTKPMPKGPNPDNLPAIRPGLINRNPKTSIATGAGLGYYAMSGEDEEVEDTEIINAPVQGRNFMEEEEEAITYNPPEFPMDKLTVEDPRAYGEDKMNRLREVRGPDTVTPRMEKRLRDMEAEVTGQKEDAQYMAMIKAGLAIAGGTSQNAITNIAEGGMEGIDSYVAELKEIREREDKIFDLDLEIAQATRKEELAIAMKGFDSEEAAEARNIKAALEAHKIEADTAKTQFQGDIDLEKAKIGSSVNAGGYYGLKGTKFINDAITNDIRIQSIDKQIAAREMNTNPTAKDMEAINGLIKKRQAREAVIRATLGYGVPQVSNTMPPQNFSGYSATEVTE